MKQFLVPFILLVIIMTTEVCAQKPISNKAVHIIAQRNDSTVSLRWAPSNPDIFLLGKKNGYKVERAEIKNGTTGDFEMVNMKHIVTYWPQGAWQWFLSQMQTPPDSSRMMYMHIGYSMLFSDSLDGAQPITEAEKDEALKSQYSYAMLAADRDSMAALGLGLRFEDWFITPGQKYLYRITVLGDVPKNMNATDSVVVGGNPYLNKARGTLRAEELENTITLYWKNFSDYTGHRVDRSDDGGKKFEPLMGAPMITLITGDTIPSDIEHYNDTALTNYKVYYYRVYGYTSFGNPELIGEIKAMPRDRTPPEMPTEVHADNVAPQKVKITWQMNEPVAKDLIGFHIGKDTVDEGGPERFPHLTTTMLSANAREYMDESGVFANKNYYVIEAFDTAKNMVRSFSAYCVMIDSTPTAPPKLLKGLMDTNGVVTIEFERPADRDYMGYRLLRANDPTHEFSVMRERISTDSLNVSEETSLRDTAEVRTLTRYIYYKMYALDYHFNESQASNVLRVKRPDLVPPVPPVITGYIVSDTNVVITFAPSSSEDVEYQKLVRKLTSETRWDSIANISSTAQEITDRSGTTNAEYDYALQAVDSAGLSSELSNNISARRYDNGLRQPVRNVQARYDSTKSEVTLSWDYDDLNEPFSYIIYRTDPDDLSSYALIKDKTVRNFTDARLPRKNNVRYAVKIVTSSGAESKLSMVASVSLK